MFSASIYSIWNLLRSWNCFIWQAGNCSEGINFPFSLKNPSSPPLSSWLQRRRPAGVVCPDWSISLPLTHLRPTLWMACSLSCLFPPPLPSWSALSLPGRLCPCPWSVPGCILLWPAEPLRLLLLLVGCSVSLLPPHLHKLHLKNLSSGLAYPRSLS